MFAEVFGLTVFLSVSLNGQKLDFLMAVNQNALKTCDIIQTEVQALRSTVTKVESRLTNVEAALTKWKDALGLQRQSMNPFSLGIF